MNSCLVNKYLSEAELRHTLKDNSVLLYWLTEVKAFTPEIKKTCDSIRLEVLSQKESDLYDDECLLLKQTHQRRQGLVRMVLIYADEQPVCFARVVISDSILEKQLKDFDTLKNQPIGETLFFHSPDAYRDHFQFIRKDDAPTLWRLLPSSLHKAFHRYGRSSLFNNANGQVLVTEIFSQDLPDKMCF